MNIFSALQCRRRHMKGQPSNNNETFSGLCLCNDPKLGLDQSRIGRDYCTYASTHALCTSSSSVDDLLRSAPLHRINEIGM
jgi:hypothetical protein